jgi:hypothetical protein
MMILYRDNIRRPASHNSNSKAISVTGRGGLQSCEMSRISHFLDSWLTYDGEVVSLIHRLRFTPQKDFLILISVRG